MSGGRGARTVLGRPGPLLGSFLTFSRRPSGLLFQRISPGKGFNSLVPDYMVLMLNPRSSASRLGFPSEKQVGVLDFQLLFLRLVASRSKVVELERQFGDV